MPLDVDAAAAAIWRAAYADAPWRFMRHDISPMLMLRCRCRCLSSTYAVFVYARLSRHQLRLFCRRLSRMLRHERRALMLMPFAAGV